jgi:HK97 family phage major capsid protein
MDYLAQQVEARKTAWHAAKALLDGAAAESRDLTAEEEQTFARINADIDARSQRIEDLQGVASRAADIEAAVATAPEVREDRALREASDFDVVRALATGEVRTATFERRDLNTSDDSQVVPQSFYAILQEKMQYQGPMLDGGFVTQLNTASGEDIKVPVEASRPAATAIAEAIAITPLDPTFTNITLKSQKVAVLTKVSRELLTDSGIDIVSYLAGSLGKAVGIRANALLTVGTGTVQANGVVTASGSGITGGTSATVGSFTADNLIDLAHSVDSDYVRQGAAFMMKRSSLGALRKLKDSAGQYLYVPAASVGTPDSFAGYSVIENPDMAAIGSAGKSVLFGNFSSYHVRQVGGIEVARSDDAYFNTDEVGFRVTLRMWGDLGQSDAVKHFVGGTA